MAWVIQVHTDYGWLDVISGVEQRTEVFSEVFEAERRADIMRKQGRHVRVVPR